MSSEMVEIGRSTTELHTPEAYDGNRTHDLPCAARYQTALQRSPKGRPPTGFEPATSADIRSSRIA